MKQGFVPCKDDKPKYTEIILFQAGSDYSLSASHLKVELNAPYTCQI